MALQLDNDLFAMLMNEKGDLPDGACFLVNLPNDLKKKIKQAQKKKQKEYLDRVAAQGSNLINEDDIK